MPREIIILECTEAKAEGKPTSRYVTTRNKKSLRTPGRLEKVKFNPFLKRRTLHRNHPGSSVTSESRAALTLAPSHFLTAIYERIDKFLRPP